MLLLFMYYFFNEGNKGVIVDPSRFYSIIFMEILFAFCITLPLKSLV